MPPLTKCKWRGRNLSASPQRSPETYASILIYNIHYRAKICKYNTFAFPIALFTQKYYSFVNLYLLFICLFYHINILKMKFSQEFRMFSQKSPFFRISIVYYIQISKAQKITHPTKSKNETDAYSPLVSKFKCGFPLHLFPRLRRVQFRN